MDKNWKSLLQNDKNFDQKVPYDIKSVDEKLTLASQDLEHLNPYYTLSPIYDLTKIFYNISSALSMGFSDITTKVGQMREKFKEYPEAENIQQLLGKEIELDIYKLNGENNSELGYKKGQYKKYCSACRTFLRLLLFMEQLIRVFNKFLDLKETSVKNILGNSYDEVLAPRHPWIVRKAVGAALTFSAKGTKDEVIKLCFGVDGNTNEGKQYIIKIIGLLDKIWSAGVSFYKQCDMLDLA